MDESREPQEFFAAEYAPMSDKELTKLSGEYDDLIESAQAALRDELKKRGMEMPKPKPIKIPAPKPPAPLLYGAKSNRQLLEIARGYDALPEASQSALRDEFASRGLEPPLIEDHDEPENPDDQSGEEIPAPAYDPDRSEFVTIARYRDIPEAVIARSVLESAGIQCMLRDENTIRMDWLWSNMIGGMRLQVPARDADAARELLGRPIPARFHVGSDHDFEQPVCPKCGSHDVVTDDLDRKIKATTMLILGVPVPASSRKNGWKCNTCGCKWVDDGKPEEPDAGTESGLVR